MPHKHRSQKHFERLDATLITITGLSILLVFGLASPPLSSAGGNANGKIAFARGSGTAQEIYVMNADGSVQTRVTNNAVADYFPVISPNGAKIAFESVRNGNSDIYVIDPDGTNEQRLTTVPGVDLHPAWSPDGKQIAFSSDQNGNTDIYVIDADGSNQRRVTTHPGPDLHPVYSLDGTRFVFASVRDGDREIFTIGSGVTEDDLDQPLRLTDNRAFDSFPAWSPDGTKIVFHSLRDGNFEIYVMGVNGENQTNLTQSSTEDIFPNWSPDGTKIVFESLRGGNRDIYVMDATGNNQTRLTTDAAPDLIPSWHWERTGTDKTISGRVLDVSGGAVGDLKINVRRIPDVAANCADSDAFVRTLTDGTYSIQETPGCAYTVEPDPQELQDRFGTDDGVGTATPTSIDVFVAFNVPAVNFVAGATPQPSITGRIIDDSKCPNYNPALDGNLECGLPGVTVTGEWSGETRTDLSKPINADLSISGKYTLPNFLTGSVVRVRAFLPGYVITIIPPNTEQITLTNATRPLVDFKAVLANSGPAVSLTDPANGTTFPAAAQISINANASDADGSVSKVEFFQGNSKLGEDNTGPYSFTWNGVSAGNYSLTAVATDNGGASTTSSPVNITVNELPKTIQLSSATYDVGESGVTASVIVSRSGDTSSSGTVDFTTGDAAGLVNCNVLNTGAASSRCDYETTVGTLRFAASEASKTISIPVIDDSYFDGSESFTVTLSNPTGATLGSPSTATVTITDNDTATGANPIDQAGFFVRLHYIDFLNREPDASGFAFWVDQITGCGSDTQCIEIKRINVSAAFFLSIEFQETGYLVHRFYNLALNRANGLPRYLEFLRDTQTIGSGVVVNTPGWEALLEANKVAYANEFVARAEYTVLYPLSQTPEAHVSALYDHAGIIPSAAERQAAIDEFSNPTGARGRVLRRVAENETLRTREFNRAFVLAQYFGYLRRNPDDAPDNNLDGYNFWLTKLNQFNGNFINAEMVKAFIVSGEYKQRFGP